MWSSRPSLNSAVAHITRQYISNMACMFKYIGDTQVYWVMMNALCGVFIFQMHISEHEPQTILSLHTWRSIRKLYASCLFAKSMSSCFLFLRPLIVCLVTKRHGVYVCVHFIWFMLTPYCVLAFVSLFFFILHAFQICCSLANFCWNIVHEGLQVSLRGWLWINFGVSFCFFRGGAKPPVGRTSQQRTVWWWRCRPVRPAPGLSRLSWLAICWLPTYCWSTFSSLSLSTYIPVP